MPGAFANDPSLRENVAFGVDDQRGYKQLALFGSLDFDLIPKVLTATAGTRHYHYDNFESGSQWYTATTSPLILNHPDGACTTSGIPLACGVPLNVSRSESGLVGRASLTWHATPDVMTYYTYSQGFRPASFNRAPALSGHPPILIPAAPYCGAASTDPRCRPGGSLSGVPTTQYTIPASYSSDNLINNELGIKSEFLEHRVVLNASAYRMKWNDVQWVLGPPLSRAGFVANGPSYTIAGIELQLMGRVSEGLTLQGSSSWNRSSQTNAPCLNSVGRTFSTPHNPTPAGQCITVVNGLPFTNPWGPLGSSLPFSPPAQFNVRARYDWNVDAFRPFVMASASHITSMHNTPENYPDGNTPAQNPPTGILKYTIPGYTTYDAALGISKDNWTVQLAGSNLTNVYGPTNISSAQYIKATIPLRPRVLMANFAYRF
jgi:outer membrane receptor protein involved in Fe transport